MNLPLDAWRHIATYALSAGRAVELSRGLFQLLWGDAEFLKKLVALAGPRVYASLKFIRERAPALELPVALNLNHARGVCYARDGALVAYCKPRKREWVEYNGRRIYTGRIHVSESGRWMIVYRTMGRNQYIEVFRDGVDYRMQIGGSTLFTYGLFAGDRLVVGHVNRETVYTIDLERRLRGAEWPATDFVTTSTHIASQLDFVLSLRDAAGSPVGEPYAMPFEFCILGLHGTTVTLCTYEGVVWRVDLVARAQVAVHDFGPEFVPWASVASDPDWSAILAPADGYALCLNRADPDVIARRDTHGVVIYEKFQKIRELPPGQCAFGPGRKLVHRVGDEWFSETY